MPASCLNSSPLICGEVPAPDDAKDCLPGYLRQRDDVLHRLGREIEPGHQHVGHRPQHGDAGEVLGGVERQPSVERRRDGVRGDGVQPDGVAVGRRLGDRVGADIAARTGAILDDELLAGHLGQLARDDARERVGRPAGREDHDVAHRLVGPVVGGGKRCPRPASARLQRRRVWRAMRRRGRPTNHGKPLRDISISSRGSRPSKTAEHTFPCAARGGQWGRRRAHARSRRTSAP